MKKEIKETLTESFEEIKKEIEGKSEEELKEMERAAREQIYTKQTEEASEYIYNIMDLGPKYNEDDFIKVLNEIDEKNKTDEGKLEFGKEHYNTFDDNDKVLCMMIINLGYGSFGKQFISNLVDKDKESAKKLLEVIIQQYTDLNDTINFVKENAETMLNEKRKEGNEKSN